MSQPRTPLEHCELAGLCRVFLEEAGVDIMTRLSSIVRDNGEDIDPSINVEQWKEKRQSDKAQLSRWIDNWEKEAKAFVEHSRQALAGAIPDESEKPTQLGESVGDCPVVFDKLREPAVEAPVLSAKDPVPVPESPDFPGKLHGSTVETGIGVMASPILRPVELYKTLPDEPEKPAHASLQDKAPTSDNSEKNLGEGSLVGSPVIVAKSPELIAESPVLVPSDVPTDDVKERRGCVAS